MLFKAVLLDLDGTLYNYEITHKKALDIVLQEFSNKLNYDLTKDYMICHSKNECINSGTASSHNKLLVFKRMIDNLELVPSTISRHDLPLLMNTRYWEVFYNEMKLYNGVLKWLILCKEQNIKICIITDFMYENQVRKLESLGIKLYIDYIVTSEEVGVDKPNPIIFYHALNKLRLKVEEVCMIGDNLNKDIKGARLLDIFSFYLSSDRTANNINQVDELKWIYDEERGRYNSVKFTSFDLLYKFFESMIRSVDELVLLSSFYGGRSDLVQAGGGNISVKDIENNLLYIKSSGLSLSEVNRNYGYSILHKNMQIINLDTRPSIETPLHNGLDKYTIHLHPFQINILTCMKNGEIVLKKLFPESLVIPYFKPGEELSNRLNKEYDHQNIIFLMNHGLLVTSNSLIEIISIITDLLEKVKQILLLENFNTVLCQERRFNDYEPPLLITKIRNIYNKFVYYSDLRSDIVKNLLPLTPDTVVYCGRSVLNLDLNPDSDPLNKKFNQDIGDLKHIIIYLDRTYIIADSIKKCREIEDVLLSTLLITEYHRGFPEFSTKIDPDLFSIIRNSKLQTLNEIEIDELLNWEAEKYRMKS